MEKEKFLHGFQEQFDDTDPSLINFDTEYKNLDEWSSMMALIVIAFVDDSYGVSLSANDFKTTTTVADLYAIVSK
ncbi:acyl carrier protein [Flavobacterium myungsuense]|uniref:Acyl carrier protein n=1 Tax=Flavobacterium myungsuense TaxID=651823 RepID=A0ABW3J064_9FLAO